MRRVVAAIALLLLPALPAAAHGAQLQPVGEFDRPVYVTSSPQDPDRLFVVEREGRVLEAREGAVRPFADLTGVVSCCGGETGLLSIALAPDFESSGRLYAFYTGEEDPTPEIHVAELRAVAGSVPLSSLRDLEVIPHPGATNHYGGQLQLGPDGALYAGTGDGGGENDQFENSQKAASPLGKLLRIDPGAPSGSATVAALGLRNPFRFSFDRLGGELWIGDVGQVGWEEVDRVPFAALGEGLNFGWACREGLEPGPRAAQPECEVPLDTFTPPVLVYENPPSDCAAIIGGYRIRDASLGNLYGRYLYGDYCSGEIRSFDPAAPEPTDRSEGLTVTELNSFGEDSCGRIYAVSEGAFSGAGSVMRLAGSAPASCGSPPPAPPPPAQLQLREGYVGIRAVSRFVRKRSRALITAWASPCAGRPGQKVSLYRGRRRIAVRRLDRACTVRFRPWIVRRWRFRALIRTDGVYRESESRRLTIKPRRTARAKRRHHDRRR